jgi:hypothetical protein
MATTCHAIPYAINWDINSTSNYLVALPPTTESHTRFHQVPPPTSHPPPTHVPNKLEFKNRNDISVTKTAVPCWWMTFHIWLTFNCRYYSILKYSTVQYIIECTTPAHIRNEEALVWPPLPPGRSSQINYLSWETYNIQHVDHCLHHQKIITLNK